MIDPTIAPVAVPQTTQRHTGEDEQQQLESWIQLMPLDRLYTTPAKAAKAAPAIQMMDTTRLTSIPDADARAGLSAIARDALPIRVSLSHSTVPVSTTIAIPAAIRALGVTSIGPSEMPG